MSNTITVVETLKATQCWCGMRLAVPEHLLNQALDHGHTLYCPLGHTFGWTETEADRQRARAERAESKAQREAQRAAAERDLREDTERRLSAQKGATTRAKKRHAAGVCPCCNRTFQQLARHMATKHPDYDPVRDA